MWWLNKNGTFEGPITDAEMTKRIRLNLICSMDRISCDRKTWRFAKDTNIWAGAQTTKPFEGRNPSLPERRLPRNRDRKVIVRKNRMSFLLQLPLKYVAAIIVLPIVVVLVAVKASSTKPDLQIRVEPSGIEVAAANINADVVAERDPEKPLPSELVPQQRTDIMDCIAIVECDEGVGSGFLLNMNGKTYLMTNDHVVRSANSPKARMLDGTVLNLGEFSVATDRDLARFEVLDCKIEPLKISNKVPKIGDPVVAYGNSLGGGVVTESKGFVQGIGPNRIESNVEIVPGNSGGPIVADDGCVVGVSAMGILRSSQRDWMLINTRYDGNPRRFGIRFTQVAWKVIDRKRYENQTALLAEYSAFWDYLTPFLCFDSIEVPDSKLQFGELNGRAFKTMQDFKKKLCELSDAYARQRSAYNKLVGRKEAREELYNDLVKRGVSSDYGNRALNEFDAETAALVNKFKDAYRSFLVMRKSVLEFAGRFLKETVWDAPQMVSGYSSELRDGCVKEYQEGVEFYMDVVGQRIKEFDKTIKELKDGANR